MDYDNEELYKWIDEHPLTRPKRNISRDFSDALPLVEIMKQHFPKRVELHNYSPQNAFNNKLSNWQLLNRKVLTKLRMGLSNEVMENLANAKVGAIEVVLQEIKTKIEKLENRQDGDKSENFTAEGFSASSNGSLVMSVKVRSGGKTKTKKMVPVEALEKLELNLKEKDEQLEVLQEKVVHLENMLELKDGRIKDLTQQLNVLLNSSKPVGERIKCSRFFS